MASLGVLLWRSEKVDAGAIARFAQRAEAAGLDALWVPETWVRDAAIQLALAAEATGRIRLGSGIFNIYSRSPGLLAQTGAELDVLSGGRFDLGLGVSGPAVIEDWHSQPFERPLTRTRETFAVLRMAFAGTRVNLEGKSIRMKNFKLRRKPLQERLPLYLAANGPENTRLAGEIADGWLPHFIPLSRMRDSLVPLAEGAARAGRDLAEIDVAPYIFCGVDPDLARARDQVRPGLAFYIGAMGDYYHAQLTRWGFGAEADTIRDAWKEGGSSAASRAVPDHLVDELALCGPPERIAERLGLWRAAGVTQPILRIMDSVEEADAHAILDEFGKMK